jgi:hypothetical protein
MSTPDTPLGTFGLNVEEIMSAMKLAFEFTMDPEARKAMREFTTADLSIDKRKISALRGTSAWLSHAGLCSSIMMQRDDPEAFDSFEAVLERVLVHPPNYRDWADWWLFFAALAAGTTFQLERCTSAKSERRLTGHLLEALASEGKIWAQPLAPALARSKARLAISEIDLEVGGGEQANGGDFGVILDFDGRTVQPSATPKDSDARIIPLIFQAKRYQRPTASVFQTHPVRGPQHHLLASNKCAAAYIFYENLGSRATPLPPLVKPIGKVSTATQTDVLQDSLDFATYLLSVATDPVRAPRAKSPDDALRMIFARAAPRDLSALVVISGDPAAAARYRGSLAMLRPYLTGREDDEQTIEE